MRASVTDHFSPQDPVLIIWHLSSRCLFPRAVAVSRPHSFLSSPSRQPHFWLEPLLCYSHGGETWGLKPRGRSPLTPSCLCVTSAHRCSCVQTVRWCRTPVSFRLTRWFTQGTHQNSETSVKPTFFLSCQGKILYCLRFYRGKHLGCFISTRFPWTFVHPGRSWLWARFWDWDGKRLQKPTKPNTWCPS